MDKIEKISKEKNPVMNNNEGDCYFCGSPVNEDSYCYGCKTHVCRQCGKYTPMGFHFVDDHVRKNKNTEYWD
ncbi:MAG: hypothetical protein UZ05_CHB002002165 [Chlorobi bacterium OLB5]|nr:MAG: hypothetical protein UZ05_CHB002002165 [Chlorobi bacterium OLB5]